MTGIKQPHHLHPITAEDAGEVKPWRLPFWTEKPAWLAEKEAQSPAEQKPTARTPGTAQDIPLPTADELETIRREAYNAGLEQGLVEGRQQGRQEGYQAGHDEGYQAAFAQGRQEGHKQGFSSGEDEGRRKARADSDAVIRRLKRIEEQLLASITERDQQLPEVLSQMVLSVCEQVLAHELSQGAASIHQFVRRSLEELPAGEKDIQVVVSPDDARHLQTSLDVCGDELHYRVDDKLAAGQCRIESEHSLIEYSVADHMQQLLERVQQQLLHQAQGFPDTAEQVSVDVPEPANRNGDDAFISADATPPDRLSSDETAPSASAPARPDEPESECHEPE